MSYLDKKQAEVVITVESIRLFIGHSHGWIV